MKNANSSFHNCKHNHISAIMRMLFAGYCRRIRLAHIFISIAAPLHCYHIDYPWNYFHDFISGININRNSKLTFIRKRIADGIRIHIKTETIANIKWMANHKIFHQFVQIIIAECQ